MSIYVTKNRSMNLKSNSLILLSGVIIFSLFLMSIYTGNMVFNSTKNEQLQPQNDLTGTSVMSTNLMDQITSLSDMNDMVDVLIETNTNDYSSVINQIKGLDGSVSHTFKYVNALAATISASGIMKLANSPQITWISLDVERAPASITDARAFSANLDKQMTTTSAMLDSTGVERINLSTDQMKSMVTEMGPNNYGNAITMNAQAVWNEGYFGAGSLAVVIDTGIYAAHSMFSPGKVLGGVDLSLDVGTPYEGWGAVTNHWHGTHVAGILAGDGSYLFPKTDSLCQAILFNGGTLIDGTPYGYPSYYIVTLWGMAPEANLYAVKVFDHTGGSVSEARIISGIEYAIDLKVNGIYDVDIISMSIGGGTYFDGRDLEDSVVDYATSLGITMVVAASNDGPNSQTIASPGTANTAITVGAVAVPLNTRVYYDTFGAVGDGLDLFVSNNPEMIYFSSRGPTADGRDKPTASAVGVYVLSALTGSPGALGFASGTSMATPAMSGVVALLNGYAEGKGLPASPYDYKQAVKKGSHMIPGYADFEQGAGFINAMDAFTALKYDHRLGQDQRDLRRGYSSRSVAPEGKFISPFGMDRIKIKDLFPGYVKYFYLRVNPFLEKIIIDFSHVDLGNDKLGINSFEFTVQSSVRSFEASYLYSINVYGDAHFEISDHMTTASGDIFGYTGNVHNLGLMPGYIRIAIENDWTSYDYLSGFVTIRTVQGYHYDHPDEFFFGKISQDEWVAIDGIDFTQATYLELSWKHDWSRYPTYDLDMFVAVLTDNTYWSYLPVAATSFVPETAFVDLSNPMYDASTAYVLINGFYIVGSFEHFTLKAWYQ